jgi:hypothetical protein
MTNNSTPRWKAIPFMTTDTPLDACPHCGAKYFTGVEWECGTTPIIDGDTHRSPLCKEREARQKAEAELQRIYAGMQGSCYCCEPVGILNQKLEAEVERIRGLLNRSLYAYFYEKSEHDLRKTMRCISNEYEQLDQIKETLNPDNK